MFEGRRRTGVERGGGARFSSRLIALLPFRNAAAVAAVAAAVGAVAAVVVVAAAAAARFSPRALPGENKKTKVEGCKSNERTKISSCEKYNDKKIKTRQQHRQQPELFTSTTIYVQLA